MKRLALALVIGGLLFVGGVSFGQNPVEDISPERHPNLAAAQHLIREAYDKITVAQKDNRYDMKDHAQRAKELLEQASKELKIAAETANQQSK
jgi:hypothetical protein